MRKGVMSSMLLGAAALAACVAGCSRPADPKAYVPANAVTVGIFNPAALAKAPEALRSSLGVPNPEFMPLAQLLEMPDYPRDADIYFYVDTDQPNRHAMVLNFPKGDAGTFFDRLTKLADRDGIKYKVFDILGGRTLDWTGELTRYRLTQINEFNMLLTYNMSDDRIGVIMARRGENRVLADMLVARSDENIDADEQARLDGAILFCRSTWPLSMNIIVDAEGGITCTYAGDRIEELHKAEIEAQMEAADLAAARAEADGVSIQEVEQSGVIKAKKIQTMPELFAQRMSRMVEVQLYPVNGVLEVAWEQAAEVAPTVEDEKK